MGIIYKKDIVSWVENMASKRLTDEKLNTADRVRGVRERLGFTQEAFANKLNISLSAYKKIESAENNISVNVLKKLNELQVSSDYVLFGTQNNVDDTWRIIQGCSEEDKMYLCIMLVLHFVERKDCSNESDMESIFKMLRKAINDKEV